MGDLALSSGLTAVANTAKLTQESTSTMDVEVQWNQINKTKYFVFSSMFVIGIDSVSFPLELLRIRQQYDTSLANSRIWPLTRNIISTEGYGGLFRGFWFSNLSTWPGQMLYFGSYEVFKDRLTSIASENFTGSAATQVVDVGVPLVAGFFADVASLLVLCPGEVVSQRIMVATHSRGPETRRGPQTGIALTKHLYRTEGLRGNLSACLG